jgi:hypothetical protein
MWSNEALGVAWVVDAHYHRLHRDRYWHVVVLILSSSQTLSTFSHDSLPFSSSLIMAVPGLYTQSCYYVQLSASTFAAFQGSLGIATRRGSSNGSAS